jgi:hypothetical protein
MTLKQKTNRYDVPTIEHNRRKTDQPGFDSPATKKDIELLKSKIEEVLERLRDDEIIISTPKI